MAGEPADVVTVPRTAVTYSLYGDSVYVVKPAPAKEGQAAGARPGRAQKPAEPAADRRAPLRQDRRGARGPRRHHCPGLQAGEQVVTTGQIKLNPGAASASTTPSR